MSSRGWDVAISWRSLGIVLSLSMVAACGRKPTWPGKDKDEPSEEASAVEEESADAVSAVAPIACAEPKSAKTFVTSVVQDLYGRQPDVLELAAAASADFDPETFVDAALDSSAADDGITRFVSGLFRLADIEPLDEGDAQEASLIADLKLEPVMLVLRNRDKPWGYFFETTDIFCTERTAKLYDYPVFNTEGFVSCKLPPERAGFLGLVSVLRATSPVQNPQAFYLANNNYHRVAAALYFLQGVKLQAATDGPTGEGLGLPMDTCVPTTDMRQSEGGLIFGTAAIPMSGPTCAGCHSRLMGPISIAFRRFGPIGEILDLEDIERIPGDETQGVSRSHLKAILAEQHSCWRPDPDGGPERFIGEPGFARLAARAPTLGKALGVQIPQLLANITPDDNMIETIATSYANGGETLTSAMRGFFLSESYRCARQL